MARIWCVLWLAWACGGCPEASVPLTETDYQPCESHSECEGSNDNCAAYVATGGHTFCAPFCVDDASCPAVPGFAAACNFAWCAVLCDDGVCPDGMSCQRSVTFVDNTGRSTGTRDVCVVGDV
jgi:hypothetical protein